MKTMLNFRSTLFPCSLLLPLVSLANPLSDGSNATSVSMALEPTPSQIVSKIEDPPLERDAVPVDVGTTKFSSALSRPKEEDSRQFELLKAEFREFKQDLQYEQDWFLGKLNISLVVIAIAVALIGIFLPLVTTLLQKSEVRKEVKRLREGRDCEFLKMRKDVVNALHLCLSESIIIVDSITSDKSPLDMSMILTSVVLCFDDLIEAIARTNDGELLEREVKAFKPFLERWSKSEIPQRINVWGVAKEMLAKGMRKKKREMSRSDFVRLLGDNSEVFDWLKNLYASFAEWRFE